MQQKSFRNTCLHSLADQNVH